MRLYRRGDSGEPVRDIQDRLVLLGFDCHDETGRFGDETLRSVERTSDLYGAAGVLEPNELVGNRAEFLSGFARVIQWMLAFTVLLALIGVANTLQLGVNERRRELGLLRAVGANPIERLQVISASGESP